MPTRITLAAIAAINAVATSPPTVARNGQAIGHAGIAARSTGLDDFHGYDEANGSGYNEAGGDYGGDEGTSALA